MNGFRLSRRALLASVPGLMLLAAAGCGSDDEEPAATAGSSGSGSSSATSIATAAATAAAATATGEWAFTDDRGVAITLPKRPERIVAQTVAAAALWDYGIRPVGIYGSYRNADGTPSFEVGNIDLDQVEWLGDYGELDLEKLVSLKPDLYVDMTLYDGDLWYLTEDLLPQVEEITPTLGISMQQISILDTINRFEELSVLLGADLDAPDVVEARETFTTAETNLKAAITENPGLTVLVTSPAVDNVYIASSEWMPDLVYFRELGLDVVAHDTEDFFELISWEQINTYPADVILTDARSGELTPEQLAANEVWSSLPAVKAGQTGPWYAGAPSSLGRLAPIMEELTEIIRASRADVV